MLTLTHAGESPVKRLKRLLRPLVYQIASPVLVRKAKYRWWYATSYLPRTIAAPVLHHTIHAYGAKDWLAPLLQAVNVRKPTPLCNVMAKFGSDKGSHAYTPIYAALFKGRQNLPLRVFELGLGTNNPDVLSNMGIFGAPGASLRGWREFFPHAQIYGADIDRRVLFAEERIGTCYCDQLNADSIAALWAQPGLSEGADIILEDGLHTFEANLSFLTNSLKHLREDGLYIVEDIYWDALPQWLSWLESHSAQYPDHAFALIEVAGEAYTNMLVVHRRA